MSVMSFEDLLRKPVGPGIRENIGSASMGNIDKTGCFYHVITKSFDGGTIFRQETGEYRHTQLCRQCSERGITILFSVTMLNHTHDVLLVPDWESLADAYRVINQTVTRTIRRRSQRHFSKDVRILRRYPTYVVIRDIGTLFYEGKYVFDNANYRKSDGKYVPHSCFWMFERNYFPTPYDEKIYSKLFGMGPREMLNIYSTMTAKEVMEFAERLSSTWSPEVTKAVFYRSV